MSQTWVERMIYLLFVRYLTLSYKWTRDKSFMKYHTKWLNAGRSSYHIDKNTMECTTLSVIKSRQSFYIFETAWIEPSKSPLFFYALVHYLRLELIRCCLNHLKWNIACLFACTICLCETFPSKMSLMFLLVVKYLSWQNISSGPGVIWGNLPAWNKFWIQKARGIPPTYP